MGRRSRFDQAFVELREEFRRGAQQSFLRDIRGQLEEDDEIQEILQSALRPDRYVTVSFDRIQNDNTFSYGDFDRALVILDAISGGQGIYKPVSQLRVLRWNGTHAGLRRVLLYLRGLNSQLRFYRLLILPYPQPPEGYRVFRGVYRRL